MNEAERIEKDRLTLKPIKFYRKGDPFGCFSNFSLHKIWLPCPFTHVPVLYDTGEHRYQAMKACRRDEHDYVVRAAGPTEAKARGREIILRSDWGNDVDDLCWNVMQNTLIAKYYQHNEVKDALLRTGSRDIWEDSPIDDIWGIRYGESYTGKNLLGRCWMWVRDNL